MSLESNITTRAVRAGIDSDTAFGAVTPPLVLSSNFSFAGFNQKRKQRLQAYGYPAKGKPDYNGDKLVLCTSGYVGDPYKNGGPRSRGMHCDQQQGSSGGGWVSKKKYVVSNTSHGYPQISNNLFFGPYYGNDTRSMYKAKTSFWPSIGPVKKKGKVPDKIGPSRGPDRVPAPRP